jgi:hypothetical protein
MQDSQLLVNYRTSTWVAEDLATPDTLGQGPRPGDRAPDVSGLCRANVGHPLRLFELSRGTTHTLLVYLDGAAPQTWSDDAVRPLAETVAMWRERYNQSLIAYAITAPGATWVPVDGLPMLEDAAGEFRQRYDVTGMSAYLVRPDGYIGYRAHPLQLDRLQAYLRRIFREPGS